MSVDPRMRWTVIVACVALAALLSIEFVDRPAATYAHDVFHGAAPFVALTHIVDPIPPLAALGFLLIGTAMLTGWTPSPVLRVLLCVCVASLIAIAVKDQLKYAFGRTWPETWVNNNPSWIHDGVTLFAPFHGGAGWSSFPSGHMTLITAPLAVLMRVARPAWRAVLSVPIVLVAVGLFGADYHFVGDMIAGVLVGSVCAAIAVRLIAPVRESAPPFRPSSAPGYAGARADPV